MPKTKKDIETEVEIELKKETPNAYPFMKGLSPVTHLRRYLKTKKLEKDDPKSTVRESERDKDIRLYMERSVDPTTVSKKHGGMLKHKDLYIGSPKRMETETNSEFSKRTKKIKSGGMIKAKGNKLARSKPTKIC